MSHPVGYEDFGRAVAESIVTSDRLRQSLEAMVAGEIDMTVRMVGGIVNATGTGVVTSVQVDQLLDEEASDALCFRALIDVDLDVVVRISGVPHGYWGPARITLSLQAVPRDDLTILVEVPDASYDDVILELRPRGRMAGVIDQLGGVADQVTQRIVRYVNAKKDEPEARSLRVVELGPAIEAEWDRRKPGD
jgi:hypothetical protein